MADLTPAKAGDMVTEKALKALVTLGMRGAPKVECAKSAGQAGQWLCIDCGETPQNNMGAWSHAEEHPKHRFGWRNFESGNLEEP